MTLIKIRHRIGQPPIELSGRLEGFLKILFGQLGASGKIVDQTQLVVFERAEAVKLVELLKRAFGSG